MLLDSGWVAATTTGILGALWLTAAVTKSVDRDELAFQIAALMGIPTVPRQVPLVLIVAEGAIGFLAAQPFADLREAILLASGVLLVVFALVMMRSRRAAENLACGCFGFLASGTNTRKHIVTNLSAGCALIVVGIEAAQDRDGTQYLATIAGLLFGLAILVVVLATMPVVREFRRGVA